VDLPRLYADRIALFDYLLACLIKCQYEYYYNVSLVYPEAIAMVESIDETKALTRKAITGTERSAASRNLRADPVFSGSANARPVSGIVSTPIVTESVPTQKAPQRAATTTERAYTPTTYSPALDPFNSDVIPTPTEPQTSGADVSHGGNGGGAHGNGNAAVMKIRTQAIYDFTGEDEGELSFKKGDIIFVTDNTGDWWEGEVNGMQGVLPSNYVTLL